jgi:hypothetical protein
MQTRRILLGALAAPVLLLPACGGHDSVADPPVSSAPTSSDPADPPKQESPEHFIRRLYMEERKMENTGKTAAYARLTSGCDACDDLVKQVRSIYTAGGYIHWGGLAISDISKYSTQSAGNSYAIEFVAQPTRYRQSGTGPVETLPGGSSTDVLTLRKTPPTWRVAARARTSS